MHTYIHTQRYINLHKTCPSCCEKGYMHTHIYMHTYIHTHIHELTHDISLLWKRLLHAYTYTHAYIYTHTHTWTYTWHFLLAVKNAPTCIYIYTRIHIYTHIHELTHDISFLLWKMLLKNVSDFLTMVYSCRKPIIPKK